MNIKGDKKSNIKVRDMEINMSSSQTPPRIGGDQHLTRNKELSQVAGELQSVGSLGTASDGADDKAKRTPASQARNIVRGHSGFGPGLANKMQSS